MSEALHLTYDGCDKHLVCYACHEKLPNPSACQMPLCEKCLPRLWEDAERLRYATRLATRNHPRPCKCFLCAALRPLTDRTKKGAD